MKPAPNLPSRKKRIFVVDDHAMMREGIRLLIDGEADWEISGEAEDAAAAITAMQKDPPDVAIVDIGLKSGNGLDLLRAMKRRCPGTAALVVSMHEESLYAERAIRAGARGYIMKQEGGGKLLDGLRRVMNGGTSISPRVMAGILDALAGKGSAAGPSLDNLSADELEVFQLIGQGLDSRQIAARVGLPVKTVETTRRSLRQKLSVPTAAELFRCAVRWVEAQQPG